MYKVGQIFAVASFNYRRWRGNLRICVTFALAFILCFLLSDKAMKFSLAYGTSLQIMEPFIWAFGDSNSILLSSVLLILLFSDMPFINASTPYYLMRIDRKIWVFGQTVYIISATFIYLVFILVSTALVCMKNSFVGNVWSPTAAILGYSGRRQTVILPAMLKTLEVSKPFECMATIFGLMLFYALLLVFIMLLFNLRFGAVGGFVSVFLFSVFGFLMNPETLKGVFRLSDEMMYKANVAVGWLSPLNHATYHMHDFGYDRLPTLLQTCLIFGGLILLCFILSIVAVRKYKFNFSGTEGW